ncbi:MAG: ice-binding family protein [Bacteroidota bacterium]
MSTSFQNKIKNSSIWMRTISISITAAVLMATFAAGCKKDDVVSAPIPLADHSAVNLRSSSSFVVLAKSGVSATGVTSISGDIGLSPAAATYATGFGMIMDVSNTFATSSLVVSPGKIYASNYTPPTPSKMTTAISDMQTAYTDAAGRTSPDHTELGAGDITSMTLTPGLYKWGTGVLISSAGVTLSGSETDVWIFQIAQNLTVANGAIVTLSGGAQASNIFWQVAGQTTLGTTAAMKGIILCKTAIAMNTGASLKGKAMAQTAVTLAGNTVVNP